MRVKIIVANQHQIKVFPHYLCLEHHWTNARQPCGLGWENANGNGLYDPQLVASH